MRKFAVTLAVLALAGLIVLPRSAYAGPEQIEKLQDALKKSDVEGALSVFTDDAIVAIPVELASPRLRLATQPGGSTADPHVLSLAGKKQISAWLSEFLVQKHGGLSLDGPGSMEGNIVETPHAFYWDDNTRKISQGGLSATVDIEIKGDKIKGLWLKVSGDALAKLQALDTQVVSQPQQGAGTGTTESTVPPSSQQSTATADILGQYGWLALPAGVTALLALAFWLPHRRYPANT